MASPQDASTVEAEPTLDEITNLQLLENGLLHIKFECDRATPSLFRIAREAHLLLYRSMVEGLRGSANLAITARLSKDRSVCYERGSGQWHEIHRSDIPQCRKAWRFSEPSACAPPRVSTSNPAQSRHRDFLIGLYDALAMIQTECFMDRSVHSRWQRVSDQDMQHFEWLHERVRNEYEHFIPKLYIAPSSDLLHAASLCLTTADVVVFESNNVLFHEMPRETLRNLLKSVLAKVDEHEKQG